MPGESMASLVRVRRFRSAPRRGPDYTLPLRMQAAGTVRASIERARWILWARELRRRGAWLDGLRAFLPLGLLQLLALANSSTWLDIFISATTFLMLVSTIAAIRAR